MKKRSDGNVRKRETGGYEIAVIGSRGSGKTTLAAGLYASSADDFTVGARDDMSRSYLEKVKSELQEGRWPESTPQDQRRNLNLLLHEGAGNVTPISFRDYMGELLGADVNFVEDYVGSPDGAILLFNPGMDILSDTQERNNMISLYGKIIDHLFKCGCRHVAFVVAAADRLEGDLEGRRETLAGYEREITNYLDSVGGRKWWTRIPVTVTGRLESQKAPALAVGDKNTARAPFVYLLSELRGDQSRCRRNRTIMRLGLAALLAALAAAAFSAYRFFSERARLNDLIKSVEEFRQQSGSELGRAKELKDDLDEKYRTLLGMNPWFAPNRALWAATTNKWAALGEVREAEYRRQEDAEKAREARRKLRGAKGLSDSLGILREAARWNPLPENERAKASLLRDVDEECRRFAEKDWKAFEFGSSTNATEKAVGEFVENVRAWTPVADETRAVRSRLLSRLPDNATTWCTDYRIHQMDKLRGKDGLSTGDFMLPLKDSLRVPMTNGCSMAAFEKNSRRLSEARAGLLDAAIESYSAREWDPTSDYSSPDEWCAASLEEWDKSGQVRNLLSNDEKDHVGRALAKRREMQKGAWYRHQEKEASKFLSKIAPMPASAACMEYGSFCSDHPKSLGLATAGGRVRAAFLAKVEKAFMDYKAHYDAEFRGPSRIYAAQGDVSERVKAAEDEFSEFRALCMELPGNAATTLGDTKFCKFAAAAKQEMAKGKKDAFMQQYVATTGEISFVSTKILTTGWLWTGFNAAISHASRYQEKTTTVELLPKTHFDKNTSTNGTWNVWLKDKYSIRFNAWTEPSLKIEIEDCCGGSNGYAHLEVPIGGLAGGTSVIELPVGIDFGKGKVDSTVVRLRINGEASGKGFLDLWHEHIGE